ncbi:MAG: zinc ribbon domain-containing protein [Myxococcaceae bacterium]|nr:zinc ribbon domain-containing protein [Myxococcaceae bacterium]
MPIYEYACEKCGNEVDVLQKIGEAPPPKCEKCGAKGKMKRRVSKSSFVLKGGGWGADLYGSKKSSSSSESSSSSSSSSTTSTSSTSSTSAAPTTTSTPTPTKPSPDKK